MTGRRVPKQPRTTISRSKVLNYRQAIAHLLKSSKLDDWELRMVQRFAADQANDIEASKQKRAKIQQLAIRRRENERM